MDDAEFQATVSLEFCMNWDSTVVSRKRGILYSASTTTPYSRVRVLEDSLS